MKQNHRRKGQRGFTLIELLAVMAILAVLVGVVAPAVTGTRDASVDAQVLQDATQVRSAASDYYGDIDEAEVRTPHTITTTSNMPVATQEIIQAAAATTTTETTWNVVLTGGLSGNMIASVVSITSSDSGDTPVASSYEAATKTLTVAGLAVSTARTLTITYYSSATPNVVTATQTTSNRWPEKFISLQVQADGSGSVPAPNNVKLIGALYANVIPTYPADNIYDVVLKDKKGLPISGNTLLNRYTAIDMKALTDSGDLQQAPAGAVLASDGIPNFLWLFEKTKSATDRDDDNRDVAVFKLVNVEKLEVAGSVALASQKLVVTTSGVVTAVDASTQNKVRVTYERIF